MGDLNSYVSPRLPLTETVFKELTPLRVQSLGVAVMLNKLYNA